jgi:hypothetical protein
MDNVWELASDIPAKPYNVSQSMSPSRGRRVAKLVVPDFVWEVHPAGAMHLTYTNVHFALRATVKTGATPHTAKAKSPNLASQKLTRPLMMSAPLKIVSRSRSVPRQTRHIGGVNTYPVHQLHTRSLIGLGVTSDERGVP